MDIVLNSTLFNTTTTNSSLYDGTCIKIDPFGNEYVQWMYTSFGECVHSPNELASFYLGLALLLFYFGMIPQIIQNFIKGNADGLSLLLLGQWAVADSFSLIGALLSSQLFTQIVLAVYFVIIDIFLIGQYIFYNSREAYRKRKQKKLESTTGETLFPTTVVENFSSLNTSSSMMTPVEELTGAIIFDSPQILDMKKESINPTLYKSISQEMNDLDQSIVDAKEESPINEKESDNLKMNSHVITSALSIAIVLIFLCFQFQPSSSQPLSRSLGRKLLNILEEEIKDHNAVEFPPTDPKKIVGYVIGFISTVCYLGSRVSQIVKNFRRSSTDGMNPILFGSLFCGYVLYTLSIFLFSVDHSFLMSKFPWLTSSIGNMLLDGLIMCQYVYYTFIRKKVKKVEEELKEKTIDSENKIVESI